MLDLLARAGARRAATRYAQHDWPVIPGAFLIDKRYVCGPLCPTVGCHPAIADWEGEASTDTGVINRWWHGAAYSVLLATGKSFDVIDVPARLGGPALEATGRPTTLALHPAAGPVAVTPAGRWMFFVAPGHGLRPELSAQLDVVLHGLGSWVPAAGTRTPCGRVRWAVAPSQVAWRLPDPYALQRVLVAQLPRHGRAATFASSTPGLLAA